MQELIFLTALTIIGITCAIVAMLPERRLARALRRRSPLHSRRLRAARRRASWGVASRRMRAGDA